MNETNGSKEFQEKENLKTLERIDGKYIWKEIVSVLNFDKGIFYTIKEIFLRPGKTIQEFLLYDRKRLVKPILFIIIMSLVYTIIRLLQLQISTIEPK